MKQKNKDIYLFILSLILLFIIIIFLISFFKITNYFLTSKFITKEKINIPIKEKQMNTLQKDPLIIPATEIEKE